MFVFNLSRIFHFSYLRLARNQVGEFLNFKTNDRIIRRMIYVKEKSEGRERERDSSKFMYFHEKELARMLNDTRVKIRERKRNNVQILRDGSRLILDEITKSVGLSRRTEIYGVNFVDSPVETVLILHLHMYPYIIFPARVLHWETSLAKSTHACSNIRTNCSRTFSILSRGEELKT